MRIKVVFATGLLLALPLAAAAHGDDNKVNPSRGASEGARLVKSDFEREVENRRADVKQKVEEKLKGLDKAKQQRCERIKTKLDKKLEKTGTHQSRMDQRYTTVETRWQRLIDRATDKSVDAAALTSALAEFKELHAQFNTDFAALRDAQGNVTVACDDQGKLTVNRDAVKAAKQKVMADAVQLRTLRQKTQNEVIVPLLKSLAKASTSTGTETETDNETN